LQARSIAGLSLARSAAMSRSLFALVIACALACSSWTVVQADPKGLNPASQEFSVPGDAELQCEKLATLPDSPMSVDACKQLMANARQAAAALKNQSAAEPGDEAMTCEDITKEMSAMQGIGLSETSQAEGHAAANQYQAKVGAPLEQLHAQGVAGAMTTTAAASTDVAVQLATGGLVNPHAAQQAQQSALAEGRLQGQRMAEERRPAEQRLLGATTKNTAEITQQVQANPSFAHLVNLAIAKGCSGVGESPAQAPSPMGR
jgi:hypothetical protein